MFFVALVLHKKAGFSILYLVVSYWRKELDKPRPLVSRNIGGISADCIFNDLGDFSFKY